MQSPQTRYSRVAAILSHSILRATGCSNQYSCFSTWLLAMVYRDKKELECYSCIFLCVWINSIATNCALCIWMQWSCRPETIRVQVLGFLHASSIRNTEQMILKRGWILLLPFQVKFSLCYLQLECLNIGNNKLTSLPACLVQCRALSKLQLFNNPLESLKPTVLGQGKLVFRSLSFYECRQYRVQMSEVWNCFRCLQFFQSFLKQCLLQYSKVLVL